jgi:hypothetical protein
MQLLFHAILSRKAQLEEEYILKQRSANLRAY